MIANMIEIEAQKLLIFNSVNLAYLSQVAILLYFQPVGKLSWVFLTISPLASSSHRRSRYRNLCSAVRICSLISYWAHWTRWRSIVSPLYWRHCSPGTTDRYLTKPANRRATRLTRTCCLREEMWVTILFLFCSGLWTLILTNFVVLK